MMSTMLHRVLEGGANKMVIIYWTCGGVAKVAIIVIVRSQMDQTNHLAASRKFDFPEI